jgi:hypothetical protein
MEGELDDALFEFTFLFELEFGLVFALLLAGVFTHPDATSPRTTITIRTMPRHPAPPQPRAIFVFLVIIYCALRTGL